MSTALTLVVALTLPALLLWAEPRSRVVRAVGPVVWCYGLAVIAANLGAPVDRAAAQETLGLAMAFALPLLLFAADVRGWLRFAPRAVLGFGLCVVAATVWALIGYALFAGRVEAAASVAGMLAATYTGGTPNMAAVAQALGEPPSRFVVVNAADLAVGGVWLFLLIAVVPRVAARFFAPAPVMAPMAAPVVVAGPRWRLALGPLLAVGCIGVGLGLGALVDPARREMVILLGLSATATGCALSARVRALPGLLAQGRYALLVFCVAAGSLADFWTVLNEGLAVLGMVAVVMSGTAVTQLALCRLCGLDRDTAIITCAAGLMGPALIPPVVEGLGNREMLLPGVSTALVGFVVGTWLGVGVALWLG
ncbi:MAG: DUF819 family protein [bacterium]